MPTAAKAVRNADNLIIAPVLNETCEWTEVAATIAQLLGANAITETTEKSYLSALNYDLTASAITSPIEP